MNKLRKSLCLMMAFIMLCGCSKMKSYRPIEDINNLEGRRVGVGLAWAPDYLLTGRKDLDLMRYNSIPDMITALCYRRLDAVAVERPYATYILSSVEGLHEVQPMIGRIGLVTYIAKDKEQLFNEFNEFTKNFRQTEQYADLDKRLNGTKEFVPKDIELCADGPVLKVGICSENFPFIYIDFSTGEFVGSDIEYIKHFANAYNYNLEFIDSSYGAMELGVGYGYTDIAISGISDLYRADIEYSGRTLVSDSYMENDVVFLEVIDPDKVKINSELDI